MVTSMNIIFNIIYIIKNFLFNNILLMYNILSRCTISNNLRDDREMIKWDRMSVMLASEAKGTQMAYKFKTAQAEQIPFSTL